MVNIKRGRVLIFVDTSRESDLCHLKNEYTKYVTFLRFNTKFQREMKRKIKREEKTLGKRSTENIAKKIKNDIEQQWKETAVEK